MRTVTPSQDKCRSRQRRSANSLSFWTWESIERTCRSSDSVDLRAGRGRDSPSPMSGSGCPPRRSQRAGLPHWALASGTNVEPLLGPRVDAEEMRDLIDRHDLNDRVHHKVGQHLVPILGSSEHWVHSRVRYRRSAGSEAKGVLELPRGSTRTIDARLPRPCRARKVV